MQTFPTLVLDNFYKNPKNIVKFAKSLQYYDTPEGSWPGKRTADLSTIDQSFVDNFIKKILTLYYPIDVRYNLSVETTFQIMTPFHKDQENYKNKGWIHIDNSAIFAGVIYLDEINDPECGTSIYKLIDEKSMDNTESKSVLYKDKKEIDSYEQNYEKHSKAFEETVIVKNQFNRLITFGGGDTWHATKNINNTHTNERLTQVFFVHSDKDNTYLSDYLPVIRSNFASNL